MTLARQHRRLDRIAVDFARKREEEWQREQWRREAERSRTANAQALAGEPFDPHTPQRPEPTGESPEQQWANEAEVRQRAEARKREAAERRNAHISTLRARLKGYQLSGAEAAQLIAEYPELAEEPLPPPALPPPPPSWAPGFHRPPPHPDDPWSGGGFIRPSEAPKA